MFHYTGRGLRYPALERRDVMPSRHEVTARGDYYGHTTTIASYNWVPFKTTILVPGAPSLLMPRTLPLTIPQDSGHFFADENRAKVPEYPLEPTMRAILSLNPCFSMREVDVTATRRCMTRLLTFVASGFGSKDEYRMLARVQDSTLILSDLVDSPVDFKDPTKGNTGFGKNFEDFMTTPMKGFENTTSYYRVQDLMLGNLRCIIPTEVDTVFMHSLVGGQKRGFVARIRSPGLTYQPTRVIPMWPLLEAHAVELKTKVHYEARHDTPTVWVPDLCCGAWFSRVALVATAFHSGGRFDVHVPVDISRNVEVWEREKQVDLRRLVTALEHIKRAATALGGGCIIRHYPQTVRDDPVLRFATLNDPGPPVPPDLAQKMWRDHG